MTLTQNTTGLTASRWSITFQESSFFGDFYVTMLEHVRRCPQIASLHFSCASPSNDARLGYLAGNFPSSVQFLSFSNALSSESIETLCILLRNNNAAFSGSIDDLIWNKPLVEDAQVRPASETYFFPLVL